jgi:hypothetical protein
LAGHEQNRVSRFPPVEAEWSQRWIVGVKQTSKIMILKQGEKIHVIHRRLFPKEAQRHFIGTVEAYENGVARVTGWLWTVERTKFTFVKRPEQRTRLISIVSGDLLLNIIPSSVQLEAITYKLEKKGMRVTDGSSWYLDLSECSWE